MKKFLSLFFIFPLFCIAQQEVNIIPQPAQLKLLKGYFEIDPATSVHYNTVNQDLTAAASFLTKQILNLSGIPMPQNKKTGKSIQLKMISSAQIGQEGYLLNVTPKSITISANTHRGLIYGIQSLLQTLPAIRTNAALQVPCLEIVDYPRFAYRGMHLDVSRHFFGPEFVKTYIDLIASYKMNTFHWHLVDDQGWRIEIKKYPKLTSVGAWRVDQNDIAWGSRPQAKPGEAATYGGYYTQEQIKDIIRYAEERNISIIPEIEMPGHVASAIASYPYLSCTQKPQLPLTGGNYSGMASGYCAGNDSVFTFLENVLAEVIQLFPSKYIHIGGDELDKEPWKVCPRCQARIKKEGLKNVDELQSYFIKRIEKFVNSKNRKIIGWDEILEGGLAPDATVMSWRGETGGIEAAKMHHHVIMTPGKPLYFDHYQAGPEGEPQAFGGMNTLKNVYDYEPIPAELSADQAKYVLGAQANLWCESIQTPDHVTYMILPRMPALAEVLWSAKENRNWQSFNARLQHHFKSYGQKGLRYCHGNYTVQIKPISQEGKLLVNLSTEIVNADIYYTLDGTEPTLSSNIYNAPIEITHSVLLKASTIINGRIMGVQAAKQNFVMHKAIAKTVIYQYPVSRFYLADGPNSLTDGVRGTNVVGKFWHGFSGKDLVATIDLGETQNIQSIALGCLQSYSDWIFLPQSVSIESSLNGTDYEQVQTVQNPISINEKNARFDFKAAFPAKPMRFIRVSAKNNLCPKGHPGEGKPGWIFADEIVVE